jgi:hypothetical protein
MDNKLLNPADVLKIAIIAFLAVWLINRGLDKVGLGNFKTCRMEN